MDIVPYYGEQPLAVTDVVVRVNPKDRDRAESVVARASEVMRVNGDQSMQAAKQSAGELKAMLNEIEASRKACRQPFAAIGEAINEQARLVGDPVTKEHERILGLLNRYVTQLEAAREAEEKRRRAEGRRIEAEAQKRITEARAAQAQAEANARAARDEAERLRAQAEAQAQQLVAQQEELSREIALEVAELGVDKNQRGLVRGGRVDHNYEFRLVSLRDTINAGCINLLRWELNLSACHDSVKGQLAIDPNCTPSLPGIEVTRTVSVSVKASARVS